MVPLNVRLRGCQEDKRARQIRNGQQASRVASAMHAETSSGNDPFAKFKGLICEMNARLEEKASADATHTRLFRKSLAETKGQLITDNADLLLTEDALAENTATLS